ncbi:hypothetical protein ACXJY6_18735 [Vibrio sp. RC27]
MSFSNTEKSLTTTNRNSKGRFIKGNTAAAGGRGNPNPLNQFPPGNQTARTNGAYSNSLPGHMFEMAKFATLQDELDLARTRLQMNLELMGKLERDIEHAESEELKLRMLDIHHKMNSQIDVLTFRIESLTKTISKIGVSSCQRTCNKLIEQLSEFEETEVGSVTREKPHLSLLIANDKSNNCA